MIFDILIFLALIGLFWWLVSIAHQAGFDAGVQAERDRLFRQGLDYNWERHYD